MKSGIAKVLNKVRDSEECNYTKSGDISNVSWIRDDDRRASNNVSVIEGLIVECGDAKELDTVIEHGNRVEETGIRYWRSELGWDLTKSRGLKLISNLENSNKNTWLIYYLKFLYSKSIKQIDKKRNKRPNKTW